MRRNFWPLCVALLVVFAWAEPKGTVPRSAASQYPAHAEQSGTFSLGAKLLKTSEVRKTFVSDLNRCCIVIELAIFPQDGKSVPISLDEISVKVSGNEITAKAASPTVISATLQKRAQQDRDVTVSPVSSIGYESGSVYDPSSGRVRGGGIYTSAGVGVGLGQRGAGQPGASDKDRAVMETELREKALPEGDASKPVGGYVYFQLSPKKDAKYQLLYTIADKQISLNLP